MLGPLAASATLGTTRNHPGASRFDAELFNFIRLAPQLRAFGIHTFLPTADQLAARDKPRLRAFGDAHGLRVPAEHFLYGIADLTRAGEALGWPLVVKGFRRGFRRGFCRGSRRC